MNLELLLPNLIKIFILSVVFFVESLFIPGGISITRIGYKVLKELNHVDIVSYYMDIKIEEDKINFDIDLKLKAIKSGFNEIYLLLNSDYKILSLSYDDKTLIYEKIDLPSQKVNILFIRLPTLFNKDDEFTINIKYSGKPTGPLSYLDKELCELDIFNMWYPLTGMEDFFEVTQEINVRKKMFAIGTGKLINIKEKGDRRIFSYKTDKKVAVMSLAVAAFHKLTVDKNTTIYYSEKNKKFVNKIKYFASSILNFYKRLGFIPQDNVRIVLTENNNKTAYTSLNNVLIHYVFLEEATDKQLYHLLSHELAHLFFGNIVAPKILNGGFLLCEGLAQYFSLLAMRDKYGEEEFKRALLNELSLYKDYLKKYEDKPLYSASYFEGYQASLFYYKGSLVFNMFSHLVGEENFYKILRVYLKRFEFKFSDVDDFHRIVQSIYKKDINWFFNYFIKSTKNIDYSITKATVEYKEKGYQLNILINNYGEASFKEEVEILVVTNAKKELFKHKLNGTNRLKFDLKDSPRLVIIDPELKILDIDRENNKKTIPSI